jgi:hypothetical protein
MIRWDPVQPMGSVLLGNQRPKAQFQEGEDFARAPFGHLEVSEAELAQQTFNEHARLTAVHRDIQGAERWEPTMPESSATGWRYSRQLSDCASMEHK